MTLDPKALEAAIRADQWPANLHAIVDAVNAASDDNDLSTEQCVALGIILASRPSAIVEEPIVADESIDHHAYRVAHIPEPPPSPQPHTGRAWVTEEDYSRLLNEYVEARIAVRESNRQTYTAAEARVRSARAALNAALTVEPVAGEVTRLTMWAEVVETYEGDGVEWRCSEESGRDSDTRPVLELAANTFPKGTKLEISEPDPGVAP